MRRVTLSWFALAQVAQVAHAQSPLCIASHCPKQLARCAIDGPCRSGMACLAEKCAPQCTVSNITSCDPDQCMLLSNGTACGPSPKCTLRCFDLNTQYGDIAFNDLTECMFSHGCAPQMHGDWPAQSDCVPPPAASVDNSFDLSMLEGRWYITRGLSQEFDTYDCQVACNRVGGPHRLNLTIWYDITREDGSKIRQVSNQSFFAPDHAIPGHLRQYAWMHGQDDWYVIAATAKYWFVKYCGCNDTWCGYGGGFVYTRTPTLDPALEDELRAAATRAGFDYDQMVVTNNHACGVQPTPEFGRPAPQSVVS